MDVIDECFAICNKNNINHYRKKVDLENVKSELENDENTVSIINYN